MVETKVENKNFNPAFPRRNQSMEKFGILVLRI